MHPFLLDPGLCWVPCFKTHSSHTSRANFCRVFHFCWNNQVNNNQNKEATAIAKTPNHPKPYFGSAAARSKYMRRIWCYTNETRKRIERPLKMKFLKVGFGEKSAGNHLWFILIVWIDAVFLCIQGLKIKWAALSSKRCSQPTLSWICVDFAGGFKRNKYSKYVR